MFNNFSHAIMFHHFHDEFHPKGQGSISSSMFEKILTWLKKNYNLISADLYYKKVLENKLRKEDVCLSFDDALLCQYDIALPILEKNNLKAFFFIYSSPILGEPDFLEIFRYFRCIVYKSIDLFYMDFFNLVEANHKEKYVIKKKEFSSLDYLKEFPFYTKNDKWFRYLRDIFLGKIKYTKLMKSLMKKKKFNYKKITSKLWMADKHLINLNKRGHIIGLHSYSHPTTMRMLPVYKQYEEYLKNKEHLEKVLEKNSINSMSHPCGSYNKDTLEILKKLNINVGFRSNTSIQTIKSALEIPREDHANLIKVVNK